MSTVPDPVPQPGEDRLPAPEGAGLHSSADLRAAGDGDHFEAWPAAIGRDVAGDQASPESESYLEGYAQQLPPPRFPNVFDVGLMGVMLLFAWLASGGLTVLALHLHLFGVTTEKQAMTDIHYTLGAQAAWYFIALAMWIVLFPAVWHKGFFDGIEWRASAAVNRRWRLFRAAIACFVLAIIDGLLLPGPKEAPIDEVFRMPGAAWGLFAFGVTMAPFMEEIIFRGFLLPAFCTAWDWWMERLHDRPAPWPDEEGRTKWSPAAMMVASVATSIPFALMHGYQTDYSLGPFLLLFCVSLALCWVRLSTRSLAASTLVHASYNLLLFSLMLLGTGGFKHLERL